ncbi:MAG TPA: DUF1707 domain-containing protein [Micromonosporaceae bacterium]
MDQRADMRASDGDRAAVAEQLRGALDEGRLDLHEYDERLQHTYAAKTYGELARLLADLPGTVPPDRAQVVPADRSPRTGGVWTPAADGTYPGATRRWLIDTWDGYLAAVPIVVAIWAVISLMSGELQYFWPGWVAGPWGGVLLVTTVTGLAKGEPQRWAAKQARKQQKKIDGPPPDGAGDSDDT